MQEHTTVVASDIKPGVRALSALLKPMANENRLMVLCLLLDGERSVSEMTGMLGLGQASLSQHLARLRLEGLVETRREGQSVIYSLCDGQANQVLTVLRGLYCRVQAGEGERA